MKNLGLTMSVAVLMAFVGCTSSQPRDPRVLIIGIDGCRPDALAAATTPNLDALIRNGSYSDQAQNDEIPVSGPCWSAALCGVWSNKHGVRSVTTFDGNRYDQYPYFFRRVKEARPDAVTATIFNFPEIAPYMTAQADIAVSCGRDEFGDTQVIDATMRILAEENPVAVFVHMEHVDHTGHIHNYGPHVAEYVTAIEHADGQVGQILGALQRRPTYEQEDWLIIGVTDHGGEGTDHYDNIPIIRTIFLIVSGPAAARGTIEPSPGIVDVAATALTHLGVPIDPAWNLDGKPVGLRR